MGRGTGFWIAMAVFQVAFGLAIFALTRQYYIEETGVQTRSPQAAGSSRPMSGTAGSTASKPWEAWRDSGMQATPTPFSSLTLGQGPIDDPEAVSNQADEYFSNGQYDLAAVLYEQLLTSGWNNVNTYNSLGITLHYLGRSAEALRVLNDGVAADASYPRIWLTLGFVNAQVGNLQESRTALEKAIQLDPGGDIGRAATDMLGKLP